MSKKFNLYSFYYIPQSLLKLPDNYIPLWAGKNNQPQVEGFTGDDTGENISEKNKYYSELTGIYWVWKNTRSEIVGSCHYRRFFTTYSEPFLYRLKRVLFYPIGLWKKRHGLIYTQNFNFWGSKILTQNEAEKLLNEYDAILPVRRRLRKTVKEHYQKHHNPEDLNVLRDILKEHFPEYLDSYENLLSQKRLFANNMFVMKWERFDKMMTWLFFMLFEFEKRVNLEKYEGYQERIFGFLSERLITLWILHNKIHYRELTLIYFKKFKNR